MHFDTKCITSKGLPMPKITRSEVIKVTTQLDLFNEAKVEIEKPEPMTEVKLGHRSARVPLRKQRRAALARLMDILADLEGKVYEKHRTKESGATMPEDIRVDQLSDYQMQHLDRLKDWLYRRRITIRQDRDRAELRERKEAEVAEEKALQPALFDL